MNQLVAQPSKLDEYRIAVLPPERARDLYTSLPSHIKPAVFERNLVNALMANPSLMEFDPRLIFREISKAAGLGLLLDPILGEGYIVVAYNYKSQKKEPQLRVGYKGMCKLARQAGNVSGIYAHEVHALDDVECDLGFPKIFHHRPKLFCDRGDIVGYVATVTFKDGTFDFEPMSVDQCQGIRDRSDAWKAFKANLIKSTPWATDEAEMSKKTALRRLMKRQEQSPELAEAIRIEDEAENPEMRTIPEVPRARVPSPSEMAPTEPEKPGSEVSGDPVDDMPDTGEKVAAAPKADPEPTQAPRFVSGAKDAISWLPLYLAAVLTSDSPETVYKWIDANKGPLSLLNEAQAKEADDAVQKHLKFLRKTKSAKADPISSGLPPKHVDPEAVLAEIDRELAAVEIADDLQAVWDTACEPLMAHLDFPPDQDAAQALFRKHEKRLGG
jgi:recombination protein RecT